MSRSTSAEPPPARRPRVGVQLPEVEREVRWPEYVAIARAAEESGLDSVWLGDHLLYRERDGRAERGPWETWSMLAGIAATTRRVRLGPLVACTAFRPPAMLAKTAATVDEIAGGRLVLGLGAGWNEDEFRAFGLPFDHRAARFEEAFEIVRRLLAGERVTFDGRFEMVDDAVLLPAPRRRIPLMIGSNGPRLLNATLPHVDAWNTWYDGYGNTPDGFERLNATVTAAAQRIGRDPSRVERSACALVVIDRSSQDRSIDVPPIEGTANDISRGLRELAAAGADEVIVVLNPITERSVRVLGDAISRLG